MLTNPGHKQSGFVATPESIAWELVQWAVRQRDERVLDLGTGEGVFLVKVARRLRDLGATPTDLGKQVYGVEKNPGLYARTISALRSMYETEFSGVRQGNLFECYFPPISSIVGNPPYVRRASLDDVDAIHSRILHHDLLIGTIPRLADLCAYFLIYAERFLIQGGRLAVIISSSWLDTRSGKFLKRFLLDHFRLHAIVSCDARMFEDALVKSVLFLAEKGVPTETDAVKFVRLREFRRGILSELDEAKGQIRGAHFYSLPQNKLQETLPWSIYLRTPGPYFLARAKMRMTLGKHVESRIGIQPLARDFFVFTRERAHAEGVKAQHCQPIAYSPRHVHGAIIADSEQVPHRILCTWEPRQVMDPKLRAYIERAERMDVPIRGKGRTVIGYHNVPRLRQAGRDPWYNLTHEIERRGRYTIFIPRRFYETFVVVWNKAGVIAGENFIELLPKRTNDTLPLLAVLNSSFFELVSRCHAQQYGGGVFNLNPVDVKLLPTFTLPGETEIRTSLIAAFERFASAGATDKARCDLDLVVGTAFKFTRDELEVVRKGVFELRTLGKAAKRVHTGSLE